MDLGIKGKTALITAAGGGLGRAIAIALAAEGVNLALGDVNPESLAESAKLAEAAGAKTISFMWDLADLAAIDANVSQIEQKLGPVDILVAITGGPPPTPAAGQDLALWTKHFQSMVLSVIALADRVLPAMRTRKWGRIITNTSSGVISPIPNLAISNTLRLSLVGWSKSLSREVAKDGITANIVAPGRILTDRVRSIDAGKAKKEGRPVEEVTAESLATIPAGRYGDPAEYAAAVAFLAGQGASYITGTVLRVDGGMVPSV